MILFITAITTMKYIGIHFTRDIAEDLSKQRETCHFLTTEEHFGKAVNFLKITLYVQCNLSLKFQSNFLTETRKDNSKIHLEG